MSNQMMIFINDIDAEDRVATNWKKNLKKLNFCEFKFEITHTVSLHKILNCDLNF